MLNRHRSELVDVIPSDDATTTGFLLTAVLPLAGKPLIY